MFNPKNIIQILNRHHAEYIIIGGVAASLHGCPEQTYDLDILYDNSEDNKRRLLDALNEIEAKWDMPLTSDMLNKQYVFALNTKYGYLDIFNYVAGLGHYSDAIKYKEILKYSDEDIQILNLDGFIKSKEAIIKEERNPRKLGAFQYIKDLYEFKKEERTLEDIKKILRDNEATLKGEFKVKEIGIFGSFVRGEASKKSDIDILIDFYEDAKISFLGFIHIENYLTDLLGVKVDLVDKTALKPRIGKHILDEVKYI